MSSLAQGQVPNATAFVEFINPGEVWTSPFPLTCPGDIQDNLEVYFGGLQCFDPNDILITASVSSCDGSFPAQGYQVVPSRPAPGPSGSPTLTNNSCGGQANLPIVANSSGNGHAYSVTILNLGTTPLQAYLFAYCTISFLNPVTCNPVFNINNHSSAGGGAPVKKGKQNFTVGETFSSSKPFTVSKINGQRVSSYSKSYLFETPGFYIIRYQNGDALNILVTP